MTRQPRALDLFCGAGGAAKGLHRAGFDVVGADIKRQPNYPFRFLQADALDIVVGHIDWSTKALSIGGFDFIWASPPCQRFSTATKQSGDPESHPDLIDPVRQALIRSGVPFVIENVAGAPIRRDLMLCGSMFGLGVVRHRWFEIHGFDAPDRPAHKHSGSLVTGEYVTVAGNGGVPAWTLKEREKRGLPRHRDGEYSLENWSRAMGIDWMTRSELVEAIPPAYSEFIGRALLAAE